MSAGGIPYDWDLNGNLLSDGSNSYSYDHANRLVGASNAQSSVTFAYNGLGDRLQQTIGGLTAQYTLDINNSLSQVLADGTDRYLYGMGRIAQQTPGGWQYFLPDALGSARQLTDATGALVLAQSFDPYGGLLASQGTAVTPYGFAGEWGDAGGLLYLRARYYLPQAGIFTAGDTWAGDFTAPASLNRYIYARNNPLRYIDPTGHDVWDTIGEFSTGMVYEFAWASSWVSPQRPWILAPSSCESVARLAGRSVGDIFAILVGVDWLVSGAGGAGAGLTMCGTGVLCPAGVGVLAASGVAVAAGGVLTVGGAIGLGQNLVILASKQGHHPWPKYLLGPEKQKLYGLSPKLHAEYHAQLDELLSRRLGTNYYQEMINSPNRLSEVLEFLRNFNKYFDETYGTHTYEALEDILRSEGLLPKP